MRKQYFNPDLAIDLGINAAIVFQFVWETCKNDTTPWVQCHDGRRWVEFPKSRFQEVFPYMSVDTVYHQLRKLETFGLIESTCLDTYTKTIKSYSPRPDSVFYDPD